ncbi:MAG: DUF4136 domain-containing protein [Polaromonas sp.]|nr:DUF4136 domain-containing protein [Polaromonas sp.]
MTQTPTHTDTAAFHSPPAGRPAPTPADAGRMWRACRARLGLMAMAPVLALLTACASPITAKVTSFNQWPADVAGSTFSYITPSELANDLEQATYAGYVQAELEKVGLRRAPPGQVGRIQVDLTTDNGTKDKKVREAVYQDNYIYLPPYRDAAGNVFSGFWSPDPFGSRYVGDREVIRTVQVSNIRLRLLDSKNALPGKPRAVFESRAVYEGDNEDLPDLVPYLVRAAFEGFPGQSGRVRTIKFDPKTGAMLRN